MTQITVIAITSPTNIDILSCENINQAHRVAREYLLKGNPAAIVQADYENYLLDLLDIPWTPV